MASGLKMRKIMAKSMARAQQAQGGHGEECAAIAELKAKRLRGAGKRRDAVRRGGEPVFDGGRRRGFGKFGCSRLTFSGGVRQIDTRNVKASWRPFYG
jgi:hypothetical protein